MAELKKLFEVLDINPALLDNPNDREKGVAQLLAKAQELANSSVVAANKLNNSFDLWGEPLASAAEVMMLQKASMRSVMSSVTTPQNSILLPS